MIINDNDINDNDINDKQSPTRIIHLFNMIIITI